MGTLLAHYLRVNASRPDFVESLRARYPKAYTEAGFSFWAVEHEDFEVPYSELEALSEELQTDVIWLSFQSVVDAFEYHHWQNGTHLRGLVYGCWEEERVWERATGDPEDWEKDVLFPETALRQALEYAQDDAERKELERIWKTGQISAGAIEPGLDARECARGVATRFGFPGWGLTDEDA